MDEIININTIVEDDIFKIFKNSVICPICKSILVEPQLCLKCQNNFCKKCIDKWSENNNECPNKCSEPEYKGSMGKKDILSKLKFKCQKCEETYFYNEIKNHYENCTQKNFSRYMSKDDTSFYSEINEDNKKKLEHISNEELSKLEKDGVEVTNIKGKKFFILF